jgi:hypothetical protein
VADACADGLLLRASRSPDEELREQALAAAAAGGSGLAVSEPKAQWEIELERQQAAAQAAAATGEGAPAMPRGPAESVLVGQRQATEAETQTPTAPGGPPFKPELPEEQPQADDAPGEPPFEPAEEFHDRV